MMLVYGVKVTLVVESDHTDILDPSRQIILGLRTLLRQVQH